MRVLIIDDENNIRRMNRLALETAGYEVGEARDGPHGLEMFGNGSEWDVVLLDQKMPGITGLDTLRQLKRRRHSAPVVMVTAYGSIDLAVEAMKSGATDFVTKPTTPERIRAAVAASLESPQAARLARTGTPDQLPRIPIETLTMNGFRILPDVETTAGGQRGEHRFRVRRYPDGVEHPVTVSIDPEAVDRVARLTGRRLAPEGSFWRQQAEQLLAAYLWSEGHVPEDGRLTVMDVSRDHLDITAAWTLD